jgi:hypothetical protein
MPLLTWHICRELGFGDMSLEQLALKTIRSSKGILKKLVLTRWTVRPVNPQVQRGNQRQGLAQENHKILYKINQVFPSADPRTGSISAMSYTLGAGQHEVCFI